MSYLEDEDNYGDEDQNDLMEMIRRNKEDICSMEITSTEANKKIHELIDEIENHETAKNIACAALASAEQELSEVLDEEYRKLEAMTQET